jgi:lycopene beta-cyclase
MTYDLIFAGGGLANGLIAWRLLAQRPDLRILILEREDRLGGAHTWSFHDDDLSDAQRHWIRPLVARHWARYEVRFPDRRRTLASGYASITSAQFATVVGDALGERLRTGVDIARVQPQEVTLATGEVLRAGAVIDGRGAAPSPDLVLGSQAFLGQEVRLRAPHGLDAPIIMDASVPQGDGYRFVYVLPFTADTLLIEDTHYIDHEPLADTQLRMHIRAYATERGWVIDEVLREERGVLPITLAGDFNAQWARDAGQARVGLRAGLFHCTTGYSLPHAVRLADALAAQRDLSAAAIFATVHGMARREWRAQGFFRLLNRMLFLAGRPQDRWRVMQRFYGLPEPLIRRFYAGHLTALDKIRILSGKPPVPVGAAMRAALRHSSQHFGMLHDDN